METRQQRFMYDNRLSPMAKIFLAEISHYTGTYVSCLDDDLYFSTIFKTSTRQVQRWKRELFTLGYIKVGKNQFGRRTLEYVPDLENHEDEVKTVRTISYLTDVKGLFLRNVLEACDYFNNKIDTSPLPESARNSIRTVSSIFANCLFSEEFYNIKIRSATMPIYMTQEFYQYIIKNYRAELFWKTSVRIMENYNKIENLHLYVLTCIATLYDEEYKIARKNPKYARWCQEEQLVSEAFYKHIKEKTPWNEADERRKIKRQLDLEEAKAKEKWDEIDAQKSIEEET